MMSYQRCWLRKHIAITGVFKLLEKVAMEPKLKEAAETFPSSMISLLKDELVELSLYGSAVRGEMHEGSDVGVLVIVKGGREEALKALEGIYEPLGAVDRRGCQGVRA
jgi:predicted nucleotidyltransferase